MQSYWQVMCVGLSGGIFLPKLERLAKFKAIDVEYERFILDGEKIEHSTFLVTHQAACWKDLVLELLHTAQVISPVWKTVIQSRFLSGETSRNLAGPNVEYPMRLSGHRSIIWTINEKQYYERMRLLNGTPNRW